MSFDSTETCICEPCYNCEDLVDSKSSRLPVCKLQLRSRSEQQVWKEIKEFLLSDPARTISAHVLASLLLFPNATSPLCFTTAAARKVWSRCEGGCTSLTQRLVTSISALRGFLLFIGKNPYKRVLEDVVNLQELIGPRLYM